MTKLIRIAISDEWIVDYDKERGMYRVSYFQDNHFQDEFWFDAYEEKETSLSKALKNYKLVECRISDEQFEILLDKWNSIGCTSFQLSSEKIRKHLEEEHED